MRDVTPFDTERLTMRTLSVDDADALHDGYRDDVTMRYWSSAPHRDLAETIAYLAPRARSDTWRGWAITLKDGGEVIGTVGAGEQRTHVMEIGYMLVPTAEGQGYAREAVRGLIDLLFDEGARRIFADTDPDNVPSNKLLERLGFAREGLLRAEWETHIGIRDSIIWGLLREEWRR